MPIEPINSTKISIQTPRGITLSAYLYKRDPKRIVITSHGFTSDQFGKSTLVAQKLEKHAISALTFDFSGCGESQDDTISVEKEVEDLTAVIDYARSLGYEQIGIMGTSLGGLIALKSWQPEVRTMVLWCPVTHAWDAEERYSQKQLAEFEKIGYLTQSLEAQPAHPRTEVRIDRAILEERTAIDTQPLVSRVTCPVLIIHGDQDTTVSLVHSQEALTYLSSNSRLDIIPGADHFFASERDGLITRSAQWFAKQL